MCLSTFRLPNVLRATTAFNCLTLTSQRPTLLQLLLPFCLEMCFAHPRATACTVSFLGISTAKIVPGVRCFLLLDSKSASRQNGVKFLSFHLTKWLRARRFSEPIFATLLSHKTWAKSIDISAFSRAWIFFLLTVSLLTLLSSDCSHHCYCICPYVGSLTSRLPWRNHN